MRKDKIEAPGATVPPGHRLIALASGHPDLTFHVAVDPLAPPVAITLRQGEQHAVVADDSPDDGIAESLAQSLVDKGVCTFVKRGEFAPAEDRIIDSVPAPLPAPDAQTGNESAQ